MLTKKGKQLQERISSWAAGKITLNQVQEEAYREENNLKLTLMREEHKRKMEREDRILALRELESDTLVAEINTRKRCMEEKHALEMQELRLKIAALKQNRSS